MVYASKYSKGTDLPLNHAGAKKPGSFYTRVSRDHPDFWSCITNKEELYTLNVGNPTRSQGADAIIHWNDRFGVHCEMSRGQVVHHLRNDGENRLLDYSKSQDTFIEAVKKNRSCILLNVESFRGENLSSEKEASFQYNGCDCIFSMKINEWAAKKNSTGFRKCPNCEQAGSQPESDLLKHSKTWFAAKEMSEITIVPQVTLEGTQLRADVGIYYEGKLSIIIEVDGPTHYSPIYIDDFSVQVDRDYRKMIWCENSAVPIIRVDHKAYKDNDTVFHNLLLNEVLPIVTKVISGEINLSHKTYGRSAPGVLKFLEEKVQKESFTFINTGTLFL